MTSRNYDNEPDDRDDASERSGSVRTGHFTTVTPPERLVCELFSDRGRSNRADQEIFQGSGVPEPGAPARTGLEIAPVASCRFIQSDVEHQQPVSVVTPALSPVR
jgi:hypothetical protein